MKSADSLVTANGVVIDAAAIRIDTSRASGAGGQHVNTTDSRVTVVVDLASAGLDEVITERLIDKLGPFLRVSSQTTRSQHRNRAEALWRAGERIDAALVVEPLRRKTKVPRGVKERRIKDKQSRSQRLADRRID
jgi:ribosome-associated protein